MGDILHHPERATAITAGGEGAGSQMAHDGPRAPGRDRPGQPGAREGGGGVWECMGWYGGVRRLGMVRGEGGGWWMMVDGG